MASRPRALAGLERAPVELEAIVEVVDRDAARRAAARRAATERINAKLDQLREAALPDPSEGGEIKDADA